MLLGWLQITNGLQWKNGMIPYSMAKRLITIAVTDTEEDNDDNEALVYVKELKKSGKLKYALESETRDDAIIEIGYRMQKCGIFKKNLDDINIIRDVEKIC